MGWLFIIVFAVIALAALWRFGNLPQGGLTLVGAALMIAIAGYAWQGSPSLQSAPAAALAAKNAHDTGDVMRHAIMGRFGGSAQLLDTADVLIKDHDTEDAVGLLHNSVKQYPDNADLWVGYGNALVAHGGGMMSPAADFAFSRAAEISPQHPGPPFFKGLALAQSGRLDDAEAVWQALLTKTPADAPWRKDLESKLAQISGTAPVPNAP